MNLDFEIPQNHDIERRLLGALLLMRVEDRDAAIQEVSYAWFVDPWHRRFFEVLRQNRRRDFGAEMLDAMRDRDNPMDRAAWWISQLFLDRDGEAATRPGAWEEYAATLYRIYKMRVEIMLAAEALKEKVDAYRIEAYSVCESSRRDAEVHERPKRAKAPVVLDGVTLS